MSDKEGKGSRFDASLPAPYKENWREAYQSDSGNSPRRASYQAPGGAAIPFIQQSFRFSGGQSQDTAEYPFGGLWSHEYLNEKPQNLVVEGCLRGPAYIAQRNRMIESLRIPTDDDHPGYLDLPFWGRFPVVIGDNYEISETTDEQGQCALSIPFRRAGVSIAERMDALPSAGASLEHAVANLRTAALDDFEARLTGVPGAASGNGGSGGGSDPGGDNNTGGGSEPGEGSNPGGGSDGGSGSGDGSTGNEPGSGDGGTSGGSNPEDGSNPGDGSGGGGNAGGGSEPEDSDTTGGTGPGDSSAGAGGMSVNTATLASGFSRLKDNLLNIIGRIQGAKTTLDTMTGKVMGMINLINQGVRSPRELAQALFNAASSITGGILEIKNNIDLYGRMADTAAGMADDTAFNNDSASSKPTLPLPDNERNAALLFLSAGTYTLPVETATASQENTKEAVENLYRTAAFLTAAGIIAQMDSLSYKTAQGYWQLMETLEDRIDRENPRLYAAVGDLRTALSQELSGQKLSRELKRTIAAPTPLLYLAYYLGCDEDKIRELNRIADSFVISGDVIYV